MRSTSFFPLCSIKWSKDGQEYLTLPGKSSTTEIRELERVTSKLRIGNAASEDAGRYACQATNAFGTSHFTIDVTIWGKGFTSKTFAYLGIPTKSVIFFVYDFLYRTPTNSTKSKHPGHPKSKCQNCMDCGKCLSWSRSVGGAMERTIR